MNRQFALTNPPTTSYRCLKGMPGLERMNRHFGETNMPTTFYRCLKRMPGFEGLWWHYRTSYSETPLIKGSGASNRALRRFGLVAPRAVGALAAS
jgi:hypothetical protein